MVLAKGTIMMNSEILLETNATVACDEVFLYSFYYCMASGVTFGC
jgi:hypothetical protein